MNKIEKLIKEFCPDGVEWKKLGEVCEFRRGAFPQPYGREEWYGGVESMPFIQVADMNDDDTMLLNEKTKNKISKIAQSKSVFATKGTVLCSIQGTIGRVALSQYDAYIDRTIAIFYNYKVKINKKYFSYILKKIFNIKKKHARGSTLKTITKEEFKDFEIPVPSLEIQEKIVKILDNFTKYVTELQAELQARNKQYNYYRDMLLSENYLNKIAEKIYEIEENRTLALVPIKEVCIRQRGFSITAGEMKEIHKENAPIKIFAGGKTTANIDEYNIDKKYIIKKPSIIVKSRGNIDFEFYDKPFSHKNELWSYSSNDDNILNIKYLYYYLKKNIKYFEDKAISGKLPQISTGITDNYKFFIPSIIIQNKIVKILDKFQELLSDTKGLLPLEIEQRRKQYEYYREKLLTFDKEEGYALSTAQHSTAQQEITSKFFELLKEAAKIAGVDISDKVEWKTLSEVAKYSKDRISFEYLNEKNYIGVENLLKNRLGKIDSSNVPIEGNSIKFDIGDTLIGNIRPYLRKIWLADVEGGTNGDVLAIRVKDKNKILPEFLYQLLSDEKFFDYNIKYSKGAKMPRGDKEKIMEYKIPLPPLPVQEYIVSILDKFDALVNDLSQGLPKEIELRQKQYEYYREKLLNFEK